MIYNILYYIYQKAMAKVFENWLTEDSELNRFLFEYCKENIQTDVKMPVIVFCNDKKEIYFKGSKIYTGDNTDEKLQIIYEKIEVIKAKMLKEFEFITPREIVSINYIPNGKFNIPMHAEKTKYTGASSLGHASMTDNVYKDVYKLFLGTDRKIIIESTIQKKTFPIKNNMLIEHSGLFKTGIPIDRKITSDLIIITFM